ncbi:MAG TPA: Rpp14/Pop5 family protein [Candidatus Nanoarchaeia archaeon]|nr:Rpp14/Pop5 family protein [Candidatus Nanoarchaeia archaeon]
MKINKRQKPLLPSLREKRRYLAFEIVSESRIDDFSEVSDGITASALSLLGYIETAKAGLIVMGDRWDRSRQRGIIRTGTRHLNGVMASLALIDNIKGKKAMARSLGVSGALNKAARYIAI